MHVPGLTQLADKDFESVRETILSLLSSTSRSNKPAIYGIVAAAEVERLRPFTKVRHPGDARDSDVSCWALFNAALRLSMRSGKPEWTC